MAGAQPILTLYSSVDVENALIETIKDHKERTVRRVGFQFYANTLWIVLPSGRKLAYIKPKPHLTVSGAWRSPTRV